MIQRIQTLYLLTVVILSLITLFSPVAGLQNVQKQEIYELSYKGLVQVKEPVSEKIIGAPVLSVISVIIPLLAFVTIFLYKRRFLQIRLTVINIILMAGYYGILFIYLWQYGKTLDAKMFLEIVSAFPLVNIVLSLLAVIAIGKDEALIKSLNRIR